MKEEIGDRLRFLVETYLPHRLGRDNLTHAEVAGMVGVQNQLWSRWVNNPQAPPGLDSIHRIGDALRIQKGWLLFGEGGPDPERPEVPVHWWRVARGLVNVSSEVASMIDAVEVVYTEAGVSPEDNGG